MTNRYMIVRLAQGKGKPTHGVWDSVSVNYVNSAGKPFTTLQIKQNEHRYFKGDAEQSAKLLNHPRKPQTPNPGTWKWSPLERAFGHEVSGPEGVICSLRQTEAKTYAALIAALPDLLEVVTLVAKNPLSPQPLLDMAVTALSKAEVDSPQPEPVKPRGRGRKPSSELLNLAHVLEFGQTTFIEFATKEDARTAASRITMHSRFATEYRDRRYETHQLVAVGKCLEPVYLLKVTRIL